MRKQLNLITLLSTDTGMKFGESKCTFFTMEPREVVPCSENPKLNGLTIQPLQSGDNYMYLEQDEVRYNGFINEKTRNECLGRVKKIRSSKLSTCNYHIAHNTFVVSVLTHTYGLLNWSLQELNEIDVQTHKMFSVTGNFNINRDVDMLYLSSHRDNCHNLGYVLMLFENVL